LTLTNSRPLPLPVGAQPAPISILPTKTRKSGCYSPRFSAGVIAKLGLEADRLNGTAEAGVGLGEGADGCYGSSLLSWISAAPIAASMEPPDAPLSFNEEGEALRAPLAATGRRRQLWMRSRTKGTAIEEPEPDSAGGTIR